MSTSRVAAQLDFEDTVAGFERILVATDFSAGARAALDCALGIARSFHSQIYLVHAIPTGLLYYVSPEDSDKVIRQAEQFASQEMQRLINEAGCADLVQAEILSGATVWPLLQEFSKAHSIDLLVLGTHGRAASTRQSLGPVAEELFRMAECPVLTVGKRAGTPAAAYPAESPILFATDFKPHSEYAMAFAYALERRQQARMTVLHVVEDQHDSASSTHSIVQEFMVNRMRRGIPQACFGKCEPEFKVRFGDPGEQILQEAREEQSSLIVLGMREGKDVAGRLPSPVAYRLACQAPCPVLTIRH